MPPANVQTPQTPPPISPHGPHDSPFSDYWTDASFSPNPNHPHCFESHPSQRPLLQRINSIGAQIVRVEPQGRVADILGQRLDALEAVLAAPETRSRMPAELEDSGLFLEDEEVDQWRDDHQQYESGGEGTKDREHGEQLKAEDRAYSEEDVSSEPSTDFADLINSDLAQLLERISTTQESLRRRCEEVKHINELVSEKLEHTTAELATLRETNGSLLDTLQLNSSELVFLNLQLQKLEQTLPAVAAAATSNGAAKSDPSLSSAIDTKAWRTEANRWKYDSRDIKKRFAHRAAAHGVRAESHRDPPSANDLSLSGSEAYGDEGIRAATPRPELRQRAATAPLLASGTGGRGGEYPSDGGAIPGDAGGGEARNGLMSTWRAFWESLADAAGVLDYGRLLFEEPESERS